MPAKFEIYKDTAGEYRFRLKSGNGENILASEAYTRKVNAENGISSVKAHSPDDENYERKTAINSKAMFNLKASNHQVIGTSQLYSSKIARDKGIDSVKSNAPNAEIVDLT